MATEEPTGRLPARATRPLRLVPDLPPWNSVAVMDVVASPLSNLIFQQTSLCNCFLSNKTLGINILLA